MSDLEYVMVFWVLPGLVMMLISLRLYRATGNNIENISGEDMKYVFASGLLYPVVIIGLLIGFVVSTLNLRNLAKERKFWWQK